MKAFITKTDAVVEALRREILQGEIEPGGSLQQDEVANRLGVSSTPVREAFSVLEAEGFLERRPHRGVVVAEVAFAGPGDAEFLLRARLALESLAIRRLVATSDTSAMARMRAAVLAGRAAIDAGKIHASREANYEFHHALAGSAPKPLAEVMQRLTWITQFFAHGAGAIERLSDAQRSHERILTAIERNDSDAAIAQLDAHMNANIKAVTKVSATAVEQ